MFEPKKLFSEDELLVKMIVGGGSGRGCLTSISGGM